MELDSQEESLELPEREGNAANPLMLEEVAGFFKVLSEPLRLALLRELRARELTVGQLAACAGTTIANVSKHLAMMKKAGILERRKKGTQVYYRLENPHVFEICDCICGDIRSRLDSRRNTIREEGTWGMLAGRSPRS